MANSDNLGDGIVFGLGSGRCGTSSLSSLLHAQPDAACFHEMNPSAMAWEGAKETVGSLVRDFLAILSGGELDVTIDRVVPNRDAPMERLRSLERVTAIGDVGSYYLPYTEMMLRRWPGIRFPCLRRDKNQVVESFVRKLSLPDTLAPRNHWTMQADKRWRRDAIWDRCFPNFDLSNEQGLADYAAAYYDQYYAIADDLVKKFTENVRVFEMTKLNSASGRAEILEFCLPGRSHVDLAVHSNIGQAASPVGTAAG